MPTLTSEDPHALMDRLEQRLRQLRPSDRAVTWDDFDGLPVANLLAQVQDARDRAIHEDWLSSHPFEALEYDHEGPWTG